MDVGCLKILTLFKMGLQMPIPERPDYEIPKGLWRKDILKIG